MNNRTKIFGENLNLILLEKNISRAELAEKLGISLAAVASYIYGKKQPPLERIFQIAELLKVSVSSLTGENQFSAEFPNVEKIVDDKIFKYRLQRAYRITAAAAIDVESFNGAVIISVPTKEQIHDDGKTEIIPCITTEKLKNVASFVELVEQAEKQAMLTEKTLADVLVGLIDKAHTTSD